MRLFIEKMVLHNNIISLLFPFLVTLIAISVSLIIVVIYEKKAYLSIATLIKIKEIFLSIIPAVWIFSLLYLHFALLIWLLTYYILHLVLKFERKATGVLKNNYTSNRYKLKSMIEEPISFEEKGFVKIVKKIELQKKQVFDKIKVEKGVKMPILYPSLRVYLFGLLIPTTRGFLFNTQYNTTVNQIGYVLIENYVVCFSVLYLGYFLAYYAFVCNIISLLYERKRLFNTIYALFSLVIFAIFTGIAFV